MFGSILLTILSCLSFVKDSFVEGDRESIVYLIFFVIAVLILMASYLINKNKFDEHKAVQFLDSITRMFDSSILVDGGARAIIFIFDKRRDAFFTLCATNGHAAAKNYRMKEDSKDHIWYRSYDQGDPICEDIPADKRTSRGIISVFSVPICNAKGEKVGVLVVDSKKSIYECTFLKDCPEDDVKTRIAKFGEAINAFGGAINSDMLNIKI